MRKVEKLIEALNNLFAERLTQYPNICLKLLFIVKAVGIAIISRGLMD